MTGLRHRLIVLLLLLSLAGCTNLPFIAGSVQQPGKPTSGPTVSPTSAVTQQPEDTQASSTAVAIPGATQQASGATLRVWLPPEFDPEKDADASRLLKGRLLAFETEHPELKLEVRIKSLSGPGGMLESLAAANVSAPLILPDLVLLPRPMLESAALKGLLTPFNGLTSKMDDGGWFNYAQELAHLKTDIFGLPFAGDALVLAYKPSLTGITPQSLDELTSLGGVLLFPASDPQALFTLALYINGSGSLQDKQGRPYLDKAGLTRVLQFERDASLAGTMPYWLTLYSSDAQTWDVFAGDQSPMIATWASTYLKNKPGNSEDLAITSLPTWDGTPFTLANGWSWALTGPGPDRRVLGMKLAEYLVDSEFMAAWTSAAGFLPPRKDALQSWQDSELRKVVEQISSSAQLIPPSDLVASLGPELEQAVVNVLKAESDPEMAAQSVINQVNQP